MPSVGAGVIMETPPGGSRGSMATLVVFLMILPVITLLLTLVDEPERIDPDWETELLWLALLPLLLLLLLLVGEGAAVEAGDEFCCVCEAEVGCTIHSVSFRRPDMVSQYHDEPDPESCLAAKSPGRASNMPGHAAAKVVKKRKSDESTEKRVLVFMANY